MTIKTIDCKNAIVNWVISHPDHIYKQFLYSNYAFDLPAQEVQNWKRIKKFTNRDGTITREFNCEPYDGQLKAYVIDDNIQILSTIVKAYPAYPVILQYYKMQQEGCIRNDNVQTPNTIVKRVHKNINPSDYYFSIWSPEPDTSCWQQPVIIVVNKEIWDNEHRFCDYEAIYNQSPDYQAIYNQSPDDEEEEDRLMEEEDRLMEEFENLLEQAGLCREMENYYGQHMNNLTQQWLAISIGKLLDMGYIYNSEISTWDFQNKDEEEE